MDGSRGEIRGEIGFGGGNSIGKPIKTITMLNAKWRVVEWALGREYCERRLREDYADLSVVYYF